MHALVAVASKHGSTREIAQVVADELRASGVDVDLSAVDEVTSLDQYDAVVVGSAVYMGRWLAEAERFVDANRGELGTVPVWLFSSGPLGTDGPDVSGEPRSLPQLMATTYAREHRTFHGRLDPDDLGLRERLAVKLVHAPTGDFRDWEAVRAWAREIGEALRHDAALAGTTARLAVPAPGAAGTP